MLTDVCICSPSAEITCRIAGDTRGNKLIRQSTPLTLAIIYDTGHLEHNRLQSL